MNYEYIEQLLNRYFECETTLEEERILRTFFAQKECPARLLPYRDIFVCQQQDVEASHLGDDFDERILALVEEEQPAVKCIKISMLQRLRPLYRAAACVAFVLTIGMAAQMPYQRQATLDAEEFAAQHAKDTVTIMQTEVASTHTPSSIDSTKVVE